MEVKVIPFVVKPRSQLSIAIIEENKSKYEEDVA